MNDYDDEHEVDDVCPRCRIGRIHLGRRPYLELYQGHLFTIPDATTYECDVCDWVEFDEGIVQLIGDMVFGASIPLDDVPANEPLYRQPPTGDDDLPAKPAQHSA